MKPLLRACLARIDGSIYAKDNKVAGPEAGYERFYYELMATDYNTTLIDKQSLGVKTSTLSDGSLVYDGCLGSIQRNESDYTLGFVANPVYGQNLSMGGYYGGSEPIIFSAYDPQVKPIEISILTSLGSSTPIEMKLLFISSLILLFMIYYSFFKSVHLKRKKSSWKTACNGFDIVYGCLLRQYSCFEAKIERKRKIIRPLLFLTVLFTYIFMHFVCSLIKTDQVVIPEPNTIRSYQQIIENNGKITPILMKFDNDHVVFQFASENTTKKHLWNQILKQKGGENASIIKTKPQIMETLIKMKNQTAVVLTSSVVRIIWSTNTCIYYKITKSPHNVLVSKDPGETVVQVKTSIKRRIPDFEGNVNRFKRMDDIFNAFFEMGLNTKAHDIQALYSLRGKPFPKGLQDPVRECLSNTITSPHPEFTQKKLKEFSTLFIYCWIANALFILVILLELYVKHNSLDNKIYQRRSNLDEKIPTPFKLVRYQAQIK